MRPRPRTPSRCPQALGARAPLARPTHIVPELRGVGRLQCGHAVLDERDVEVALVLDDAACRKDGPGRARVLRERVAEALKGAQPVADAQVEQAERGQQLGALGRELERLDVDVNGAPEVLLLRQQASEREEGGVVARGLIRAQEGGLGLAEEPQLRQALALVVPHGPLLRGRGRAAAAARAARGARLLREQPLALGVDVRRAAVAAQQEERASHLLERRDGARVQARGRLEELQALEHAALLAPQQALDDERVLAERAVRVQLLLDHGLARRVLAAQVQQVHEPALVRHASHASRLAGSR